LVKGKGLRIKYDSQPNTIVDYVVISTYMVEELMSLTAKPTHIKDLTSGHPNPEFQENLVKEPNILE